MTGKAKTAAKISFSTYGDQLVDLLGRNYGASANEVDLALDGGTAAVFRRTVPISSRRSSGAFFTGRDMAERLLDDSPPPAVDAAVVDPTCGAGDLLLAAAKQLPKGENALATLHLWGEILVGRDLDRELIRVARLRLALLAAHLNEGSLDASEHEIAAMLPNIEVGDGRKLSFTKPVLLLLNPPYGTIVAKRDWGSGRLPRAAVFAEECFRTVPEGSQIRAILPDVLRSGSSLARWRERAAELLTTTTIESWGQFDPWTDVDVFLLRGERADGPDGNIEWWQEPRSESTVSDAFAVSVGVVVPHRDQEAGPSSPYLCARDLPAGGEHTAGETRRRHNGTRFDPPFVVIRRTSRPVDQGHRLIATLVRASEPVLVENHLIVCRPLDGTIASCKELLRSLRSSETTAHLNQRIRCRHLTVSVIKQIPLPLEMEANNLSTAKPSGA
jgi:N-6 DNA Methylase